MQNAPSGKSALGLDGNIAAMLGYIVGIVALILIFIEKDNKFVRFHAIQSMLWVVLYIVGLFAIIIVGVIISIIGGAASQTLGGILAGLTFLLYFGWILVFLGGIIYSAIKAFGNNMNKLPIVGSFAEKWA